MDRKTIKKKSIKIAVFASGNGTNFQALVDAQKKKKLRGGSVTLLVCDNPSAYVLQRAYKAGVAVSLIKRDHFASRADFEAAIIRDLEMHNIGLIVLAGFMRLLSPEFVKKYYLRLINIHPALLPAFKGAHGIKDAFEYGVKFAGVSVHFVDELTDHGPIILQGIVPIKENDSLENLEERIHKLEHQLYPQSVNLFLAGKLKIQGRRVKILTS